MATINGKLNFMQSLSAFLYDGTVGLSPKTTKVDNFLNRFPKNALRIEIQNRLRQVLRLSELICF